MSLTFEPTEYKNLREALKQFYIDTPELSELES